MFLDLNVLLMQMHKNSHNNLLLKECDNVYHNSKVSKRENSHFLI